MASGFKNRLFAVDASTIDLCLAAFPWASFRRTKGAIKLHVGVDQAGHLPTFISVTDGKTGDVTVARTWTFPAGGVVVADRAYLDWVRLFFVVSHPAAPDADSGANRSLIPIQTDH